MASEEDIIPEDRFTAVTGNSAENLCFLCLKEAAFLCKYCGIPYCSKEHFDIHYDEKNKYCYPFRVLQRPEVGRYLVATRDLKPLEIIIKDDPAVFGPNHDTGPACLECLLPVDGQFLCEKCSLPLCGPDCVDKPNHKPECQVFSQPLPTDFQFRVNFNRPIPEGALKVNSPEYCCIAPLRGLELKRNNPVMWRRLLLLMDHEEERKNEPEYQEMFQVNVINFLRKVCGLDYEEAEIFRILGIIRTNALQVQDPIMKPKGVTGRVVYPTLSYISHSCVCNARYRKPDLYSMSPEDHSITIRSQTSIAKGEEISIQYLSFMYGHLRRKSTIKDYWFFDCACQRCQDPSELESYMSALKCPDCESGYILPIDSMDLQSQWLCSKCQHQQSSESVQGCRSILSQNAMFPNYTARWCWFH